MLWAALWQMVIRPVRRLTSNIIAFGEKPAGRRAGSSSRAARDDEIGRAETALAGDADRRSPRSSSQRKRLAELGMAVARINHDLRNMLAAAQLISDRLATIPDPLAQRLAPQLVATLDRAIEFCQSTLTYGAGASSAPARRAFDLREVVRADRRDRGRRGRGRDRYRDRYSAEIRAVRRSRPRAARVSRISAATRRRRCPFGPSDERPAAIRFAAIRTARRQALIEVSDSGPGFPPEQRAHIFEPFHCRRATAAPGSGLAIAGRSGRAQWRRDRARAGAARRFLLRRALSHHPADAAERRRELAAESRRARRTRAGPPLLPKARMSAARPSRPLSGALLALAGWAAFSLQDALVKSLVGRSARAGGAVRPLDRDRRRLGLLVVRRADYRGHGRAAQRGGDRVRAALILVAWLAYYRASRSLQLADLVTYYFAAPLFVVGMSAPLLARICRAGPLARDARSASAAC